MERTSIASLLGLKPKADAEHSRRWGEDRLYFRKVETFDDSLDQGQVHPANEILVLDLTLQEALARHRGDWAADISAYDTVHEHILAMADLLSSGIIRQFPRKFRS